MTIETAPREEPRKTTAAKTTRAALKVRPLVKDIYRGAHEAKAQGKPVAYAMAVSIYDEILRAMDIYAVFTENYSGVCAAKKSAETYLLKAEAEGYANCICGYVRTGLGFDALRRELGHIPDEAPDGGLPAPDLLLGSSGSCDPRFKWYQALGRYMNVPTYSHDVVLPPFGADANELREHYVQYQTEQLHGLVEFLEMTTGRKLDKDRLWEVIRISDDMDKFWWQAYQLRKVSPCPMPSEDHFSVMVPGFFLRGKIEARDYYRDVLTELQERVANKLGTIPDERYRLIWAKGLPPWHTMWILNYFRSLGAVFVIDIPYRPRDLVEVPSSVRDPLEYLAYRNYLSRTLRYERAKKNSGNSDVECIVEFVKEYKVDAMVTHVMRSCRAGSIGQIYVNKLTNKYVPVPGLLLTSDMVDARDYSESDWKGRIDSFMEMVEARKKG